ncbi:acyltransferase [Paraburkholderia strydomiana]
MMRDLFAYPAAAIDMLNRELERIGTDHFTLPSLARARSYDPSEPDDRARLAELGIRIEGDAGSGNVIVTGTGSHNLTVRFSGTRNNCMCLGESSMLRGQFAFESNENLCVIGDRVAFSGLNGTMRLARSMVFVGAGCTSNGVNFGMQGPDNAIILCDDCMLSWGVQLRTTDSHAIFSIDTLEQINHAASVVIGPHVWIGFDAVIQKGVRVGAGAIIGNGSVVTKDVPSQTAVAGVPATAVRERVCWTRSPTPSIGEIKAVMKSFF